MRFRQIFACLHVAVQLGVHIGFIEEGPVEKFDVALQKPISQLIGKRGEVGFRLGRRL